MMSIKSKNLNKKDLIVAACAAEKDMNVMATTNEDNKADYSCIGDIDKLLQGLGYNGCKALVEYFGNSVADALSMSEEGKLALLNSVTDPIVPGRKTEIKPEYFKKYFERGIYNQQGL